MLNSLTKLWERKPETEGQLHAYEYRSDAFEDIELPDLPDIPGMITEAEARYLYWLTSQHLLGDGAVVEIGTWLGRSTSCLAAGIRDSGENVKLHCFDHFQWSASAGWNNHSSIKMGHKQDFEPLFRQNVAPFSQFIEIRKAKFKDIRWQGGYVQILFLDGPKRLHDISTVLQVFARYLKPRKSLIISQDYFHAPSFEIPACFSALADKLQLIHVVDSGAKTPSCTAAFAVTGKIEPRDVTVGKLSFRDWSKETACRTWERLVEDVPTSYKVSFMGGLAMLLHDLGEVESAKHVMLTQTDDPVSLDRWQRWARTTLRQRYSPLFEALGL